MKLKLFLWGQREEDATLFFFVDVDVVRVAVILWMFASGFAVVFVVAGISLRHCSCCSIWRTSLLTRDVGRARNLICLQIAGRTLAAGSKHC